MVLLGIANFSLIFLRSSLITFNNSFLDEIIFLYLDINSARQNFPNTYQANGYIDVLSTDFIISNNHIHGEKVLPFLTDDTHELDSEADFDYLEFLASEANEIFKKLFGI